MTQTRLGYTLRQLSDACIDESAAKRCRDAAIKLDRAVVSLGRKGEGVTQLVSYAKAKRVYEAVAGKPYVPPGKPKTK